MFWLYVYILPEQSPTLLAYDQMCKIITVNLVWNEVGLCAVSFECFKSRLGCLNVRIYTHRGCIISFNFLNQTNYTLIEEPEDSAWFFKKGNATRDT